jgi:molecular chaperone DnaK (HSP70)
VASRFLIGIDLGTTNSVVAYLDTQSDATQSADAASAIRVFGIRVFEVPQLIAHGEVRTLPALPSFLYFPTADELSSGAVSATWDEDPPMVTGLLAREQGALVPARQVSSAKSWLSHSGVNRRAKILPAQAEPPQPMISPVEASARYLMHLRDAWNGKLGTTKETRFEQQEIVLTVPASFDEEARELTVEAARIAGLAHLTLLEEPLAAFYAWMNSRAPSKPSVSLSGEASGAPYLPAVGKCGIEEAGGPSNPDVAGGPFKPSVGLSGVVEVAALRDGELILICDIGGGTTDFSLVRATLVDGELQFERTAVGDHILLGGDNLDLALAHLVEEKLANVKLTLRQRYALRRSCCAVKEKLLGDASLPQLPVTILGSGRAVIGQALTVELTREEVLQILTSGFLPITPPDAMPSRARPTALRELGLPYAADAAITRHLAAFLTQAAIAMNTGQRMVRPDAVLFNGGFCTPTFIRERIAHAIANWFGESQSQWRPKLLDNDAVESAVARGAACYGRVRRGTGTRVKVGSARAYYIGLPAENAASAPQGICVLPAGSQAGTTLPPLAREFTVLANRPVSFTLYSSRTRHDAHGDLATLDEADFHRHAPLTSLLRYGKKMRELYLKVRLRAGFTEVGTLELWCESSETGHRWRLQFELRGEDPEAQQSAPQTSTHVAGTHSPVATSNATFDSAAQLIRTVFAPSAELDAPDPETLVSQLEAALDAKRDQWPVAVIRGLADVLLESAPGRKHSPRHELRWLNLLGFCLRPGFGFPGDDARIHQLWAVAPAAGVFADDLQCQVERLAMLRRICGGINASRQQALYREHTSVADNKKKKPRRNRQLEYEVWRLLASLEHLPARHRASLGRELLTKIKSEPEDAIWLWSLSRLGARIPLYGPLHCVVTPEIAAEWLNVLLGLPTCTAATASAIAAIAQRTDDSSRDIDDAIRAQAISRLTEFGIAQEAIAPISHCVTPQRADAVRSFGESLPQGLQLVSSANCLLSLPALHG